MRVDYSNLSIGIGLSGNLLSLLKSFLSNRFKWVVLNGKYFSWLSVLVGVP